MEINDNILTDKNLTALAKKHNWNEDKMLNELRKQNHGLSNSDLQAIVEAFMLMNKPETMNDDLIETYKPHGEKINIIKTHTEKLKSYNIKNHKTGITYKIKAKSYQDAKDKYENYLKDAEQDTFEIKWKNLETNQIFNTKVKANSLSSALEGITKNQSNQSDFAGIKNMMLLSAKSEKKGTYQISKTFDKVIEMKIDSFNDSDEDKVIDKLIELTGKTSWSRKTGKLSSDKEEVKIHIFKENPITGVIISPSKGVMKIQYEGKPYTVKELLNLKDSFNDDSLSDIINYYKKLQKLSYDTLEKEIFNLLNEGTRLATLAEKHIENTAKHLKERIYEKENANVKTYIFERNLKYTLADIANFFDREFEREALSEWENGRIIGKRFPSKHSHYISIANKLSKRFFEVYKQYNKVFEDSFNDDSTVTISVKPKGYLTSKNTQNTAEEIYNVTIKRRSNGDITVSGKIQNIEKFLKQSLFDGGLVPGSIKIVNDSFSEDAKWDTLLANLGFAHNQGTGDIQIWKYRDKDRDKFEKAIEHIRRVDRKLILSASSQSSGEHKITIMKPTNDSFTRDNSSVNDVYILTKNNYKAVNYNQALDYGEKYGLHQVFRVDRKEFNSLVKTAKSANVRNPNEWAFHRLHSARKTKTFDSFNEDALSQSDIEIIEDSISLMKRKNISITSTNVIDYLEENFKGFVGRNKQDIIEYVKRKYFKDSFNEDTNDYIITLVNHRGTNLDLENLSPLSRKVDIKNLLKNVDFNERDILNTLNNANLIYNNWKFHSKDKTTISVFAEDKTKNKYILRIFNKSIQDSFSEDATLAQLEIKNTFLEEDDDANEVKYLGFNDDRKISFYEYKDKYFAFFDLENRVEVITKDEVQRILKKNIIEASEKNKDELYREGDEGIAATVRSEDSEIISLSQFSPERLIKAVINNNQAMNNYVKAPDGNTYFIAVYSDFVSVVRVEPNGKQKRVVDKSFTKFNFEEALVILKEIEKQLSQGGYK